MEADPSLAQPIPDELTSEAPEVPPYVRPQKTDEQILAERIENNRFDGSWS